MKLLVWLSLLLVGCAAEVPDDLASVQVDSKLTVPYGQFDPAYSKVWKIVIDSRTDESNRQEILLALDAWKAVIPCPTVFDISVEPVTDELPPAGTISVRLANFVDPNTVGYTYWESGVTGARILLLPKVEVGDDYQRVVRHELGHAFELPHQTVPSIMLDPPTRDDHIHPVDIRSYAARWCPDE